MQTITFNLNWNGKLYCNCFTTIRPRNDEKYTLNQVYQIRQKTIDMGHCEIVYIKHFRLYQLTEAMALVDVGYPPKDAIEILSCLYPAIENITEQEFSYMVLRRTVLDHNHKDQLNENRALQSAAIPLP